MNKLDELIAELCPDGVVYKSIEEICRKITSGGTPNSKKQEYYGGDIPWLRTQEINFCEITDTEMKITIEGLKNSSAKWIPANCVIIAMYGATVGKVAYTSIPLTTNQACCNLEVNDTIAEYKYIYYCLANNYEYIKSLGQGNQTNINAQIVRKLMVPIPPRTVQREIVRMLDNFMDITVELTAELNARKRQYEYYREQLMKFDNVPYVTIDTLFPFIRNGFVGTVTKFFTNKENGIRYLEGTNIHNGIIADNEELYVTKEFHNKHIKNELKPDDILMVQSGHIGECAVVGDKYKGANCHALIIMSNAGKCLSKFYVHYFHTIEGMKHLKPAITDGNLKHVLAGKMSFVKVPYPPVEEQERIVDILDKFEALCNDISDGLPAEISARQKQYEYYRDKLLTFKQKEEVSA